MNLRVLLQSMAAYVSVALILFGLSGYLNKAFGIDATVLGDAWKMLALAVGGSFLTAIVYPHVRAIRQGDQLVAFVQRVQLVNGVQQHNMDVVFVTALENGKMGQKIRVALSNGYRAEGVVTSYAGTFTPAQLKITEAERSS